MAGAELAAVGRAPALERTPGNTDDGSKPCGRLIKRHRRDRNNEYTCDTTGEDNVSHDNSWVGRTSSSSRSRITTEFSLMLGGVKSIGRVGLGETRDQPGLEIQ